MREIREASTRALRATLHALDTPGIIRDEKLVRAIKAELLIRKTGRRSAPKTAKRKKS